ncbi:MAG: TIGR03960 family B12-binding radical SAM protein [Candidatus Omnitrophica bacterium]|nr:TIGR03960 family B12-binding radical SAM protein [Candidatus Omnitrophota bacterium]
MNLNLVEKPVRYIGNEWNAVMQKPDARIRMAIAYPDVYEVGMSYLGLQILYGLLNEKQDIWCERVFAPWPDLEEKLREENAPLRTIESETPLKELHILGFSIQHEMLYTNVLAMLELGGISIEADQRAENDPLVIAGGPCCYNPMPMTEFIDAFVIGEGEDVILEICETLDRLREAHESRAAILESLGRIPGVFVPSLYKEEQNRLGESVLRRPNVEGISEIVEKRLVSDFENSYYPTKQILPNTKVIHHRLALEIMRGCPGGCRFCQAGYTDRPVRERSSKRLMNDAEEGLKNTGFGEVGLLSLSTADYTRLPDLCSELIEKYYSQRVALSLPSLRIDRFPARVAQEIGKVRGAGMTFAPEAGTERLRWAINKLIYDAEIYAKIREAVTTGQDTVKFYFMIGLPTETDEDLQGIVDMALAIKRILRESGKKRTKIHIGLSPFVPKPHTAYQWYGQISLDEMKRRIDFISSQLKQPGIKVNWHDPHLSLVEGALSRADARICSVIRHAYENGARFDEWSEHFSYDRWEESFAANGLSIAAYAQRSYEQDDLLPWDVISIRVQKRYLWREWEKTLRNKESRHCGNEMCRVCRVCDGEEVVTVHAAEDADSSKSNKGHNEDEILSHKPEVNKSKDNKQLFRYAIRFHKTDRMIFASHHDLMMLFESIFRRAGVQLAFSEGFHPHPKIIFAAPLPVGVESRAECMEITTVQNYEAGPLLKHLQGFCPPGIVMSALHVVPASTKKITARVHAYQYQIDANASPHSEDLVKNFHATLHKPDVCQELNLIDASAEPLQSQGFRLTYVCSVQGGKYTKADSIMKILEQKHACSIRIDQSVRLGVLTKKNDGLLIPLIEESGMEM